MVNKPSPKSKVKLIGLLPLGMALIVFLFVLNWFFKITPFQTLGGLPLLIAPFAGLAGIVVSFMLLKKSPDRLTKWSLAGNAALFALPLLYWTLGTLFFGP